MIKFAFIIDDSPLMLLKKQAHQQSDQHNIGMSYYQQSIYAIEEFIANRNKINEFKNDKYFLFKTIDQDNPNANIEISSWQHPFKHFLHQQSFKKCKREFSDIKETLFKVVQILNSKRFLHGSDNRMFGIQASKIETTYFILFTANPLLQGDMDELYNQKPQRDIYYKELFRFDQKLFVFNFQERCQQSAKKLKELADNTYGMYRVIHDFKVLKYNIQMLAQNSFITMQFHISFKNAVEEDVKEFPSKTILYYDLSQKIKKIQNPGNKHPSEPAHLSNTEEKEYKVIHKDKWPIPLEDTSFTLVNPKSPFLWFGSTYPNIIIDTKPIDFDASKCHVELLHVQDPIFIQHFTDKFIKPFGYNISELNTIGWRVYLEGETQNYPFALIKAIKNELGKDITQEEIKQTKNQDYQVMNFVPYYLAIWIMPLNFEEFWPLIQQIDNYKGTNQNIQDPVQASYEKTKWKLGFDRYLEKLPPYYNDYLNSYLRYLKVPIQLPHTEKVYLTNNKLLAQIITEIKQQQYSLDLVHEDQFLKNKKEHSQKKLTYKCCQQIDSHFKQDENFSQDNKNDKIYKYELIDQRDKLINNVLWQLSQVQIETFEDIIIGKPQLKKSQKQQQSIKTKSQVNEEEHEVPIYKMGDLDRVWKHREKIRNPYISDKLNNELNRPYFGNPFKAPGELGSLSKEKASQQFLTDETIFEFQDEQLQEGESINKEFTDENSKTGKNCFFQVIKTDQQKGQKKKQKEKQKQQCKVQIKQQKEVDKSSKKRSAKQSWKNQQFQADFNKSHEIIQQLRYKQKRPDIEYTTLNIKRKKSEIDDITQQLQLSQYLNQRGDQIILEMINIAQEAIGDPFNKKIQRQFQEQLDKLKEDIPKLQLSQICNEIKNYMKAFGYDYYFTQQNNEGQTKQQQADNIYSMLTENISK